MSCTYLRVVLTFVAICGPAIANGDEESPIQSPVLQAEGKREAAPHGQGNIYAPDVLWDEGLYRMWYGAQGSDGHDRIAYAESEDGQNWSRRGIAISDDHANHVNDPSVVIVEGRYYMYYTRTEKDVVDRIDLATSADGVAWEPRGAVIEPGEGDAWDSLSVGRPSVRYENGRFHLWYDGRKDFPPGAPVRGVPISPSSRRSVGYATSKDGFRWEKHSSNPVFGHGAGAVDVERTGNRLVMLYESRDGTQWASSTDGVNWSARGLLIPKSGSRTDAFGHVTPQLFVNNAEDAVYIFCGAASAGSWDHNSIVSYKLGERAHTVLQSDK